MRERYNNPADFAPEIFRWFDMTPDWVCLAGRDGYFRKINRAVVDKMGYPEEVLYGKPIFSFLHPEDRETTGQKRARLMDGETLVNFQNRYVTATGDVVWLQWTSTYIPDGEFVFAIAKDVTAQKLLEQELEREYLRFRGLATHFKNSIEEDRKVLSLELHEGLAQVASVLKIQMQWIHDHLAADPASAINERMQRAMAASDLLVDTVRRLSFSLHPGMLDDLGLREVLAWQCREFALLKGIACTLEADFREQLLSSELRKDLFRVCQDSLSLVMHAPVATSVTVRISEDGDHVVLKIVERGRAFDCHLPEQSSCLTRIRERVASVQGQIILETDTDLGTTMIVRVPYSGAA